LAATDWNYRTAADLILALDKRQVSAVELTESAIARIEACEPRINAMPVRDFDRAREAARAADAALERGERKPLLGIPITIKESYNVAGLPTTWGMPMFRDFTPAEDALSIARVKQAGAVILGKTNVPLALADWQSYNEIYGVTNNPWDLGRTPGGSSGGSAAALAAGYGPLSLGSDIGGSLRAPAHYCGVYAHKPTYALVASRGHTPPPFAPLPLERDLAVVGPMARSAKDLALALEVLAGPDPEGEGVGYRLALPPTRHGDLKSFRVLVIDSHPCVPTASSVRGALEELCRRLIAAGVRVGRESPLVPDLADATRLYMRLLFSFLAANWPAEVYERARAANAEVEPEDRTLAAERARGAALSHREWVMADTARAMLRMKWRELFREWDVVLTPVMPTPAYPHDHTPDQRMRVIDIDGQRCPYLDQLAWPGVATTPGLPATAAPIDYATGLPIGVQIIGPYLEDRTPIAFAELIEREFGGFVPPPGFA